MEQCETEWRAKQLWLREAKVSELTTFLKHVPWSAFDTESQSRPFPRDPENKATLKPAYVVFGCYMHGGVVGVTQVTRRCPYLTRVVMSVMRHLCDDFQGTSVCVSCNIRSPPHRDSYNLSGSENVVVALIRPCDGGGVWTQPKEEESPSVHQVSVQCGSKEVLGTIQGLESPVKLCPQRWHATQPWTGDRLVMIGYSIGSAHKLQMSDRALLRRYGTPMPPRILAPQHQNLPSLRTPKGQRLQPSSLGVAPSSQHAYIHSHEEGDAGSPSPVGRESAHVVDQGTAGSPTSRARRGDHADNLSNDRARCGEDHQSLQAQGGAPGSPAGARGSIYSSSDNRSAEEQDLQAPHGDSGDSSGIRKHGFRETLRDDLQPGDCGEAGVHEVVHQHSRGESRESLAPSSVCPMAQGISMSEKEAIRGRLGTPWTTAYPARTAAAKRVATPSRASGSETSWEMTPEVNQDLEMIPEEAMSRIKELELELSRLRQEMKNREDNPKAKNHQKRASSPP